MSARSREKLEGVVEADETWEGGLRKGQPGRPSVGEKSLVAAAVEVKEKGWGRARLASLDSGSAVSIGGFLEETVTPGSTLRSDGWRSYAKPAKALGLDHQATSFSKSDKEGHELLPAVHRVFSLLHRVLLTTYQGAVSRLHLPSYLAEFEFRFNRRQSRSRTLLFQRLLSASVRGAPPCYWELVCRPAGRAAA